MATVPWNEKRDYRVMVLPSGSCERLLWYTELGTGPDRRPEVIHVLAVRF